MGCKDNTILDTKYKGLPCIKSQCSFSRTGGTIHRCTIKGIPNIQNQFFLNKPKMPICATHKLWL